MKPKIFPCFRYHEKHGARVFKTEQEWDQMEPGHGWGSHPAKRAKAEQVQQEPEQEQPESEYESEDSPHPNADQAVADVEPAQSPAKKIFSKRRK